MPFPSYARLTDDDMKALYAYFMHGVAPVEHENRAVDIVWPLSMRWPLGIWRKMFAPTPKPFDAAPYTDPVVARGAYLVQAGHCGACHTPRAPTMQERGLTDADGPDFPGGAAIDGWVPTSLRGEPRTGLGTWTETEIVQFLKTGRTLRTAAFGGMTDVVGHSMQHLTDDDLNAIARYLKTLPPRVQGEQPHVYDAAAAKALQTGDASKPGAAVYRDNCMACHRSDGHGYTRVFPALAGNPVVQGDDPTSLIHVVLEGSALQGTRTAPSTFTMPPFGWRLSDHKSRTCPTSCARAGATRGCRDGRAGREGAQERAVDPARTAAGRAVPASAALTGGGAPAPPVGCASRRRRLRAAPFISPGCTRKGAPMREIFAAARHFSPHPLSFRS